ncbi:MAG: DUF2505 domain-containing protein [Deltaproteobacteria bacterium]
MKFTCRNIFHTDADTYWSKIFFYGDYNRGLYVEALQFRKWELVELTGEPGGARTRKQNLEPKSDAPAVVQKLVGGSISYVEQGRFDPASRIWTYDITLSKLADKVRIGGKFWVEPRGDKRIERICEVDISVNIFGVGGIVEKFVESETRDSYEKATVFTNDWIKKHGL